MARELLNSVPLGVIVTHEYARELESLFYLLLFIALGYTKFIPEANPLQLECWWLEEWTHIAKEKTLFLFDQADTQVMILSQVPARFVVCWPYRLTAKVTSKHKCSLRALHNLADLFSQAAFDATNEIREANRRKNTDEYRSRTTLIEQWEITHQCLARVVVFREFGEAIGLPPEDIKAYSDEV